MKRNTAEVFWSRVDKAVVGCWLWKGRIGYNGYGDIRISCKRYIAHRLAWEYTFGPIPVGLCVCHHCDVKLCVNPAHLFLGTYNDNNQDKTRKNRQARGEGHGRAILNKLDVQFIRTSKLTIQELAMRLGVANETVRCARVGLTWKNKADFFAQFET